MKILAATLSFLFFSIVLCAQQGIKQYVQANYAVIKSIDNDSLLDGYEAIAKAIGDKRVVMLGEQDHGDAPTFLAKTQLIKYLHEKKGFNVLAFESDFFALTYGQQSFGSDRTAFVTFMQRNIFPIWTYCDANTELFYRYLPATQTKNNPIIVTGFDNQFHGTISRQHIRSFTDSVLKKIQVETAFTTGEQQQLLNWTDSLLKNYGREFGKKQEFEQYASQLKKAISIWQEKNGKDYTYAVLNSLLAFNDQSGSYYKDTHKAGTIRDGQMAANLDWLVNEKYKNEKIIVWAANGHITKQSNATLSTLPLTMGTVFCNYPVNNEQTYILGFTSATGTAGRITMGPGSEYKLRKPDKDSYENWFGDAAFTFTDLLPYQQATPKPEAFKMKVTNHAWNGKQQWSKSYDGIFYIREMYHCKALE